MRVLEHLQNEFDEDSQTLRFPFLRSVDNAVLIHVHNPILPICQQRFRFAECIQLGARLHLMEPLPNAPAVFQCLTTSCRSLHTLDLHTYELDSELLLLQLASVFSHTLQRLFLNRHATQRSLNAFPRLEVLDVSNCPNISDVHHVASTLRVLYAETESGLSDEGIASATQLQALHAWNNPRITTVAPFGATLRELNCRGSCGISDDGLLTATQLIFLNACDNERVTSVEPFQHRLLALDARGSCGISDEALVGATKLVYLDAWSNGKITTVDPFADTLLALRAGDVCGIDDVGLARAVHLRFCVSTFNRKITKTWFPHFS